MDAWKYEMISRVEQDISLVHFTCSLTLLAREISLSTLEISFHISTCPCILFTTLNNIILILFNSKFLSAKG